MQMYREPKHLSESSQSLVESLALRMAREVQQLAWRALSYGRIERHADCTVTPHD